MVLFNTNGTWPSRAKLLCTLPTRISGSGAVNREVRTINRSYDILKVEFLTFENLHFSCENPCSMGDEDP